MFKKSIFLALASLCLPCFADWQGWHPYAWNSLRTGTNQSAITASVYAVDCSILVTNYTTPTNPVIITNRFLGSIYPQNLGTVSVTYTFTTWSNGAEVLYSVAHTGVHFSTNIILQPREAVAFDCYRAILEREQSFPAYQVTGYSPSNAAQVLQAMASFPKTFRAERDALAWTKGWIVTNCGRFIERRTNFVDYFKTTPTNRPPFETVTNLLARYSLPSNYLSQTPWRELWCGDTGRYRITTCVVYFATAGTNIYQDCCGFTLTNIGTNAMSITNICTNATPWQDDATFYTNGASLWGWCKITNLLNDLVLTPAPICPIAQLPTVSTGRYEGVAGYSFADWDDVTSGVAYAWANGTNETITNNFTYALETNTCAFTSWDHEMNVGKRYQAHTNGGAFQIEAYNRSVRASVILGLESTGAQFQASLYVSSPTNSATDYYNYGILFTTNYSVFGQYTGRALDGQYVQVGDNPIAKLSQPEPPSQPGTSEILSRGYTATGFWIVDWSITNGFRYK